MNILVADWETFFSQEYSLSRMTTESYVRSPEFKAHMLGYFIPGEMEAPAECLPELVATNQAFRQRFESSAVLVQHAQFDGLIFSHHYGLKPKLWLDTLSMARLVLPRLKSHSLDALAQHFGLAAKSVPYNLFKGIRDLPPDIYAQVADGCRHDVWLTHEIAMKLLPLVPKEELLCIDAVIRMFTEPVLELDRPRMERFLKEEKLRKAKAMLAAGAALGLPAPTTVDEVRGALAAIESELQSSDKFKIALESLGYACPMKYSEKQKCEIPALAKNDDGMKELLEHDDPRVQALSAARLGVKSTIDETRASRLLETEIRGALPVYLSYAAAKTLRFGGGDKTNWQNFRRGGEIRKSVVAPLGSKLVIVDAAQVECRGVNWMADEQWVLDAFAAGRDVYSETASRVFGRPITKADEIERFGGKTLELGCGFGLGWRKYQSQMRAGMLGGPSVILTDEDAQSRVGTYRSTHPNVQSMWRAFGDYLLPALANGGPMTFSCLEIRNHKIYLPNGSWLDYEGLRWGFFDDANPAPDETRQWWHRGRREQVKYYGGKLVENVIQALFSGLLIRQAMVQIAQRYKIVLQVHDEIVCVVPENEAETAADWMAEIVSVSPSWAPNIPLAADKKVSVRYDK